MDDLNDDELLAALGVDSEIESKAPGSTREGRIIAGFEEIENYYVVNGRLPQHGENRDIFERMYAIRLDRIRSSEECRSVLQDRDPHGILGDWTAVA